MDCEISAVLTNANQTSPCAAWETKFKFHLSLGFSHTRSALLVRL